MSRKNKKRSKKVYPSNVYNYGPLQIAQYGNTLVYSNRSTPNEHLEMLSRMKDAHLNVFTKLKDVLTLLQAESVNYDPLRLMEIAAVKFIPTGRKHRSEAEYNGEELKILPGIEYLEF